MNFLTRAFLSAFLLLALPSLAYASVSITEIMYDIPGTDAKHEWIEVKNDGEAVNLSEWKLYEGESNHKLNPVSGDGTLPPGAYAILADNPATFLADYPRFSGVVFDVALSGGLNNTNGETLVLRDSELLDHDTVTYSPTQGGEGDGNSLHKTGTSWEAFLPTPGAGPSDARAARPPPPPPPNPEPSPQPMKTPPPTPQASTQTTAPEVPIVLDAPSAQPAQKTIVQIAEVPDSEVSKPQSEPKQKKEMIALEPTESETENLTAAAALAETAEAPQNMDWLWPLGLGLLIGLAVSGIFFFLKRPQQPPTTS